MMDYQEFPTRRAALKEVATMRGWDAKPLRLHLSGNDGGPRKIWVIACRDLGGGGEWKYLRRDGYVR